MKDVRVQESNHQPNADLIQRCVVIFRDVDNQMGMTVSGDNPVFVQTVKKGGAADRAGVFAGDRIIKVDSTLVTSSNHLEVVKLISCATCVTLTLLGKRPLDVNFNANAATLFHLPVESLAFPTNGCFCPESSIRTKFLSGITSRDSLTQKQNEVFSTCAMMTDVQCIPQSHVDVIPMEEEDEDEGSDSETVAPLDTHGPFGNFLELKGHPAQLAVFLHYLVSNSDPMSVLFYLITDLYQSAGGSKDLRRWAYEIHSSFLVPTAPAKVTSIDSDIVWEIDNVLSCTASGPDQEEPLKRIFVKARQKALGEIAELLADFKNKRNLGLGAVYGTHYLNDIAEGDRSSELRIVDILLMPHFLSLFGNTVEFEQLSARSQVLVAALSSVVRNLGIRPSSPSCERLLEKCPSYVAKDKSKFKIKGVGSKKIIQVKGHHFSVAFVCTFTVCHQCEEMIGGISAQGYFCSGGLEEMCYPTQKRKDVKRDATKSAAVVKAKSSPAGRETCASLENSPYSAIAETADEDRCCFVDDHDSERKDKVGRLDVSTCSSAGEASAFFKTTLKSISADSGYDEERATSTSIGRSQSMRVRNDETRLSQRETANNRRAKSDVDAQDKKTSAVGAEPNLGIASDGLSAARESTAQILIQTHESLMPTVLGLSAAAAKPPRLAEIVFKDSDFEVDAEIPPIETAIDAETLRHMKPKERKRQEVINELIHTERTHVRNLKVLCKVFFNPLISNQVLSTEMVKALFPNLEEILKFHVKLCKDMKLRQSEANVVSSVGDIMLSVFDGESGVGFRETVSAYCQSQQCALDLLRARVKKDQKFAQFLQDAESNLLCRKLQLKDMIPMEMQRLTKYPLLLENISKHTVELTEEAGNLKRALDCAKQILAYVNTAKRNTENAKRLEDLQRKLDSTAFDKILHPIAQEFRGLDLRRHTLVHEGQLQWRLAKNKVVDLHVVLLQELLLLLTKTNDNRMALRFHNTNVTSGKEDSKHLHCPVLKLSSVLPKNVATDKRAFFLVCTSALGPQIYELVAQSLSEKKAWFKYIEDQMNICKQRLQLPSDATASVGHSASTPNIAAVKTSGQASLALTSGSLNIDATKQSSASAVDVNSSKAKTEETTRNGSTDRIQIVSQPRLINPSEVTIQQPTVYEHAEPVLTVVELLRRKDEQILRGLVEKQKILAKLNGGSVLDLQNLAEKIFDDKKQRNAKELTIAAIVQGNKLLDAINEATCVKPSAISEGLTPDFDFTPPAVACGQLTLIATPLIKCLTRLLHLVDKEEEELQRLRKSMSVQPRRTSEVEPSPSKPSDATQKQPFPLEPVMTAKISNESTVGSEQLIDDSSTRNSLVDKTNCDATNKTIAFGDDASNKLRAAISVPNNALHQPAALMTKSMKLPNLHSPIDRQKTILDEIAEKLFLDKDKLTVPMTSLAFGSPSAASDQGEVSPTPTAPAAVASSHSSLATQRPSDRETYSASSSKQHESVACSPVENSDTCPSTNFSIELSSSAESASERRSCVKRKRHTALTLQTDTLNADAQDSVDTSAGGL